MLGLRNIDLNDSNDFPHQNATLLNDLESSDSRRALNPLAMKNHIERYFESGLQQATAEGKIQSQKRSEAIKKAQLIMSNK